MSSDLIVLEFDNRLAEHIAADRLHYRSSFWWKADKVVAFVLVAMGLYLVIAAGVRWWTVIWFPYTVIPKRAFLDSEQQARFMSLVRQHVGNSVAVGV